METTREMKVEKLKARIGNSDYEIDADAVAEAIVERLLATRRELAQGLAGLNGNSASPIQPCS